MPSSIPRPLPLGSTNFETLRKANEIYVDKTAMIYQLASERSKIFLSRPRRFGKSLLVSTFESLFKNGIKYFRGLAIEKLWNDGQIYQVIRLDFSNLKDFSTIQDFRNDLDRYLLRVMKYNNILDKSAGTEGLEEFISWLSLQPGNSVVLLIDEYDAPLTSCMNNPELFKSVRLRLSRLYSAIKEWEGNLRFLFITGIMKFGKASVFSELNNLRDISLSPRYGTLLGYTHQEVKENFSCYLKEASDILGLSESELFSELISHYDGYCFENSAQTHVFAPWSLLNFLSDPESGFENYWFDSAGNPTVLQHYLKDHSLRDPEDYFKQKSVPIDQLKARATDLDKIHDTTLLTLAGYLTIKSIGSSGFIVGYPNKEVADALAWLYRDRLLHGKSLDDLGAVNLKDDIRTGNASNLIRQINMLYLSMDYHKYPITDETACRNYTQLFLTLGGGIRTYSELHNALGRSDIEISTNNLHWVLEAKFMQSKNSSEHLAKKLLAEALDQMRQKHYGESGSANKKLIRLGFVFAEKERQIVEYGIA